jgi:hypothetical protein
MKALVSLAIQTPYRTHVIPIKTEWAEVILEGSSLILRPKAFID